MFLPIALILHAILHIHGISANGNVYEFCADNQLFTFSYAACPGGVLLKDGLELTEPCHCTNKHLTVFSTCDSETAFPQKACHRLKEKSSSPGSKPDAVLVKLIQPFGRQLQLRNKENEGMQLHRDSKCQRIRESCVANSTNSILVRLPQFDKHSPALEIEPGYPNEIRFSPGGRKTATTTTTHSQYSHSQSLHRRKRDLSEITDEKLRRRILETIEFLKELQFGNRTGLMKQTSMTFQLLSRTVQIFNSIAPSVIIEDETLSAMLALFVKKYEALEMPGYSGKLTIDDTVERATFEDIMSRLHECASKASDVSQELEFIIMPETCPAVVTHVVDKVVTPDGSVKRRFLKLGEVMPADRRYIPETEDLVLGALWKVFDSVYSYCYPYIFSYHNAQALIYYYTIMESIFLSPWVLPNFISKDGHGTSMYASRVEHEDLMMLMKNMDYMDEAVHMLGQYKFFFLKPASGKEGGGGGATINSTLSSPPANPSKGKRRKRSLLQLDPLWEDLEIWGGKGYCLQIADPYLPPSIANAYPNIENLCA